MRYLISLITLFSFAFGIVDLGTYGSTRNISEENFIDKAEKHAKDINATLLKDELEKGKESYLSVDKVVPTCTKTQTRSFTPTFVVPADVVLPNGQVIARAGEVYNTLEVMKKNNISIGTYMMFIDATDKVQIQLSYMYKNQGSIFITNGSMQKYEQITKVATFKADKTIIEKFNVKCSPSLLIQKENELVIYEYNPKELVKEAKNDN